MASLLLSEAGARVLGEGVFPRTGEDERWIVGTVLSYDEQGIWFQDKGLQVENSMVLVKWAFVDAIVSEVPLSRVSVDREIGSR